MELVNAIINNDIGQVTRLLEAGENPNQTLDEARVTPLHFAVQHNALEIAQLLITAGANTHATTHPDNETPLDIARLFDHQRLIKLLSSASQI